MRGRDAWSTKDTIAFSLITIGAAVIRFVRLGVPSGFVFDESFYARDACLYAGLDETECVGSEPGEAHPPLGKWIISLGIRMLGHDAVGWRVGSALAGVVTVMLLYLVARKLLGSSLAAGLASTLLAFDLLHFVHSRVGMLDIYVSLFTMMVMWLALLERDEILNGRSSRLGWRRVGIGIAGGLAFSTKWSGALALIAAAWLWIAWAAKGHSGRSSFRRVANAIRQQALPLFVSIVLIPVVVYAVSFAGGIRTPLEKSSDADSYVEVFVEQNLAMLQGHRHFVGVNMVQSPPWAWPLIKRPIPFFADRQPAIREVWFGGNPLLWWPSLATLLWVVFRWARKQDPREPEGFIAGGFLLLYVPWLLLTSPFLTWGRGMVFIYYLLPAIPFMYLALAYAVQQLGMVRWRLAAAGLVVAVASASFAFFYPVLTATPLDRDAWLRRVWFDDCERPPPQVLSLPVTTTIDGGPSPTLTGITLETGDPPYGWCWK